MQPASINSALYWGLPGNRDFISLIADRVTSSHALFINLPHNPIYGTWNAVRSGLLDAHIANPLDLIIRDGTDIAADIGVHFSKPRISAEELVHFQAPHRSAVILRSEDDQARKNCERFAEDFMSSLGKDPGNIHLVIGIHEPVLNKVDQTEQFQVITFDCGISADEMEAYVGLRLRGHIGPGTTRLCKGLITEFSGFDVELAERLIAMDESMILNIVEQLSAMMNQDPSRWRSASWLNRTCRSDPSIEFHVLHDQYLAEHGPVAQRDRARERIRRRYWRACVRALTPWLEARRLKVIEIFQKQIDAIAAANNGKIPKPLKDRIIYVDPAEIEYNNIVGMYFAKEIETNSQDEIQGLRVCQIAKRVRDDIAHLRMPDPISIGSLVREMDNLIA